MAEARRGAGSDPAQIGLADFLRDTAVDLSDLYRTNGWTWSRLRREAGLPTPPEGPEEARVSRAIPRLLHLDDPGRLALYKRAVTGGAYDDDLDTRTACGRALMGLHLSIWGPDSTFASLHESLAMLRKHPALVAELDELFGVLEEQGEHLPEPLDTHMRWAHRVPLALHSRASLDEIMTAFGRLTFERRNRLRQGVDFDPMTRSDLFFVTLEKAESHYSPSTMYRDYAIAPDLFHWESQSITSARSPTGQRYLQHQIRGTHVLFFVRHRKHVAGRTAAYTCLGAADYVSHQGSRPMAITWRLRRPMPDDFFREAKVSAG
jgi:hypothetical protein